ncbi:MAG: glutamine amidotransferase [Ruminococcaceae bacterium]|nr:glutamine amidotransferase [Oscillospiraceae bacterium]
MKIVIGHLFNDLLNLYGDKGNIAALKNRMEQRGIDVEVKTYGINDDINFDELDIVFIGGGSDREQLLVCNRLKEIKSDLTQYVEDNGVLIAVCGGYQLLGHYYQLEDEKIEGLGILDIYTEQKNPRLIGNIILESDIINTTVVGFENHGGRTYINNHTPLGKVVYGNGNNDSKDFEGVVYKNVIATYLHGPLLPKNPILTDYIIKCAILNKDKDFSLCEIDSEYELKAHNYIIERFLK